MARTKINVRQQQFGFPDEDLKASLHDEIVFWLKANALELSKKILNWSGNWNAEFVKLKRSEINAQVERHKEYLRKEIAEGEKALGARNRFTPQHREELAPRVQNMKNFLDSLESWEGLGTLPCLELDVISESEVPITRERYKSKDIIGYADVVFFVRRTELLTGSLPVNQFGNPTLEIPPSKALRWHGQLVDDCKIAFDAKTTIPSFGQVIRDLKTYREFRRWPFYVVSPEKRFANQIADEGFGFIEYPEGVLLHPKRRFEPS